MVTVGTSVRENGRGEQHNPHPPGQNTRKDCRAKTGHIGLHRVHYENDHHDDHDDIFGLLDPLPRDASQDTAQNRPDRVTWWVWERCVIWVILVNVVNGNVVDYDNNDHQEGYDRP